MAECTLDDLVGKKFRDQGRGPDEFDCFGLVVEVFKRHGIAINDYKLCGKEWSKIDQTIKDDIPTQWDRVEAGEPPVPSLVVIINDPSGNRFANHVGVYIGNGWFIHAMEEVGIHKSRVTNPMWKMRIEGYYRPRRDQHGKAADGGSQQKPI